MHEPCRWFRRKPVIAGRDLARRPRRGPRVRGPRPSKSEICLVIPCEQIADVARYREAVTGPIVIPTQLSGSMLLAAIDFRPDHLKRIEKRLDGVGTASRICALPIGPDDFPTAIPPPLSSIGQKTRTGTSRAAPRTFIFKLRVIAFIFKTSVEEFGGHGAIFVSTRKTRAQNKKSVRDWPPAV
jgi:hypothetical protein